MLVVSLLCRCWFFICAYKRPVRCRVHSFPEMSAIVQKETTQVYLAPVVAHGLHLLMCLYRFLDSHNFALAITSFFLSQKVICGGLQSLRSSSHEPLCWICIESLHWEVLVVNHGQVWLLPHIFAFLTSCLAVFTAKSALPLICGQAVEEVTCVYHY